jgi:DNA-binding transcriptional MerR regulator
MQINDPKIEINHIELPPIPAKRYFTIGEVSELCGVKPHVLRYWEQEFTQLRPMKRRGNRRYYQHHEVLLVRKIRSLLYEQGFTISGARNRLEHDGVKIAAQGKVSGGPEQQSTKIVPSSPITPLLSIHELVAELRAIYDLLR